MSTTPPMNPPPAANGVLSLIGNTPLVKVRALDTGVCELYLKLENHNPGGSIKDRIGLSMITAAEQSGALRPGGHLVEATAGNTGLGLALVAAQRGYKLTLVIPDKMSQEKIFHLRALGADIVLTRSDVNKGHPAYYQDVAQEIARSEGAFYVNQFGNPANPLAHETTTGPEIFEQMGGKMDAMVCGVGSGGTLSGLSRFFAKHAPEVEMVLADPAGSILANYIKTGELGQAGSWLVEGIGEDFIPPICDLSRVKHAYTVTDEESFHTARELLQKEGILAGSSTGTLLMAALRYCREQTTPKRVVSLVCDSGNKYLSKMFNDFWMADQGFLEGPNMGDLRDVVRRRYAKGDVVTIAPTDTLLVAYQRMKLYDVSQLPVLEDGEVKGIVDESDVLLAVTGSEQGAFLEPVSAHMSTRLRTVQPSTPMSELLSLFDDGMVPILLDGETFYGLITKIDLLNHLRRRFR